MSDVDDRVLERFLERRAAQQQSRLEKGAERRLMLRWSGKALEIPVSVVVGLFLGMGLEHLLPSIKPWGTWGGLFFGIAAAVRVMVRMARQYQKENPEEPRDTDPRLTHGDDEEPS